MIKSHVWEHMTVNPRTQEFKTGELLWVWGQSGLYNKYQVNLDYLNKALSQETVCVCLCMYIYIYVNDILYVNKIKSKSTFCN